MRTRGAFFSTDGPVGGAFGSTFKLPSVRLSSQNLESKLASCREYINEQAAGRCGRAASGQGTPSGHGNAPDDHPSNGLYSKG